MEIIPGILEKDWIEIEKKINIAKQFAKSIHIDIIDGKFAPNITFLDPSLFAKYTKDMLFEVHLMVDEPIQYLKPFADAGFKRFIGHVERMSDQAEFIAEGQILGEVGLALDGPTPIDAIRVPFGDLDFITVMTIKAGASGQEFNSEYLKKAETLRQAQGQSLCIEIDGGINDRTIVQAKMAGATRFIANSFIFNPSASSGQSPQSQFNLLKTCLE